MARIFFTFSFIVVLAQCAFARLEITPMVEYDVPIGGTMYQWDSNYWFKENIKHADRIKWLEDLFALAIGGKVPIYKPDDFNSKLATQAINDYLYSSDTAYVVNPVTMDERMKVCTYYRGYGEVVAIRFREIWRLQHNGTIEKEVIAFGPVVKPFNGKESGNTLLFWMKPTGEIENSFIVTPIIEYTVYANKPSGSNIALSNATLFNWYGKFKNHASNNHADVYVEDNPPVDLMKVGELSFDLPADTTNYHPVASFVKANLGVDINDVIGITFRETWVQGTNGRFVKTLVAIAPLVTFRYDDGNVHMRNTIWLKPNNP